jgi:hypothetical protein
VHVLWRRGMLGDGGAAVCVGIVFIFYFFGFNWMVDGICGCLSATVGCLHLLLTSDWQQGGFV